MIDVRKKAIEAACISMFGSEASGGMGFMTQAIDAYERALWQPIETAPIHEAPFFALIVGRYPDKLTWTKQVECWWNGSSWDAWCHPFPPTHWRPLSPLPDSQP